ncbi:hypothetical protein BaRGS_00039634 [Batillaria attramentaria]|uniref:Uncharacterized protein n=1 Tax=Batillaria attramentaria TaxID=370345 RepID=A0ABD0J2K7_9CAEN
MDHSFSWYHTDLRFNVTELLAVCTRGACNATFNPAILAVHNENTKRSQIVAPDVLRFRFPDGLWTTRTASSAANCTMEVICEWVSVRVNARGSHSAKDADCEVVINERTGIVSGDCHIPRMFSSRDRYSCTWMEQTDSESESAIPESVTNFEKDNFTITDPNKNVLTYYNATCSFNKSLPTGSQIYRYRVVISPGNVSPPIGYRYVSSSNQVSPSPLTSPHQSSSSGTETPLTSGAASDGATAVTSELPGRARSEKKNRELLTFNGFIGPYDTTCSFKVEDTDGGSGGVNQTEPQESEYSSIDTDVDLVKQLPGNYDPNLSRKQAVHSGSVSFGNQHVGHRQRDALPAPPDYHEGKRSTGGYEVPTTSPRNIFETDPKGPEKEIYNARISRDVPAPASFHFLSPFDDKPSTGTDFAPSTGDMEMKEKTLVQTAQTKGDHLPIGSGRGHNPFTSDIQQNKGRIFNVLV